MRARQRRRRGGGPVGLAVGMGTMLAWRSRRSRVPYALHGKVVLITGGSRGLGMALAREAAAEGARVAICARDHDTLERARVALARRGADVLAVPCDVTDPDAVRDLTDTVRRWCGPVDVLINNAGIIEVGPAEVMSTADYEEAMAVNFWGMLHLTHAVLPEMRARRRGRIVNITSIGGKLSFPHLLPYSASKFAAVGFSRGLRVEAARDGVTVVTVCPGLMRTGSPRHAIFRGRHRLEYAWFSIADSLPGLSVSVESAARRVLAAAKRGEAEVVFPLPAKVAAILATVAPDLTDDTLAMIARLLPRAGARPDGRFEGTESQSWLSPSWLTRLGDRAAYRYNQVPANGGA